MNQPEEIILDIKGLTKDFPGVRALDNVDFKLKRGEIHGLVGENGAGKSTLLKIIDGSLQPTSGEMAYEGKGFFSNTRQAIKGGIGMVYQEQNIIPYFNAIENIFLGEEIATLNFINTSAMEKKARELIREVGITVDLNLYQELRELGAAEQKIIEILRAINQKPRVLILDEPTASLTIEEVNHLFKLLKRFKEEGMSIIFVSHHLEEVFEITDQITVLRNGKKVATVTSTSLQKPDLIKMMIDRDIIALYPKEKVPAGNIILEVKDLETDFLQNIKFQLKEGEIVGFAGMVGSGRTELMETVFGARKKRRGEIYINGVRVDIKSVKDAVRNGLFLVPEDRREKGIIESFAVKENLTLSHLSSFCKFDFIQFDTERRKSKDIVQQLNIDTPGIDTEAKNLSGGNKQKLSFGKWSFGGGKIFIFDEPTEGVDVGSKVEIYKLMNDLVKEKAGILLVSSDMPELISLSDRVYIMQNGKIVDALSDENINQERILKAAFSE